MTTFDLTPLFRSVVGLDRMANWLDEAMDSDDGGGYPPYNIEKLSDEDYRITMALAGFTLADLKIVLHEGTLTVQGSTKSSSSEEKTNFLHRGIAARSFKRHFTLADSIHVTGARLENGLLHIELQREIPETMKPQEIKIQAGKSSQTIVSKQGTSKNLIEGKTA